LGNGFRHNLTGRISTATTALDGCNASVIPASRNLTAMRRNMLLGEGIANKQASVPSGKRHPNVWLMPKESGSISSYKRTNMRIDGTASAEMGFPRSGSTTITIDGTASGGLIVGATGTATISINGTAAIVASLNATGTATITIDGNAALGAIASVTGETTLTVNGHSAIMGLGYLTGTTIETGELTPAGIASAVWSAIAADNDASGTMGEKLNGAGSAGNPWTEVIESGLTAAEVMRILAAAMTGTSQKTGSTIVFKGLDGTTDRITGSFDADGNRTGVIVDGN
jgi:hypothetical protein